MLIHVCLLILVLLMTCFGDPYFADSCLFADPCFTDFQVLFASNSVSDMGKDEYHRKYRREI